MTTNVTVPRELPQFPEPTSVDPGRFGVMWQDRAALEAYGRACFDAGLASPPASEPVAMPEYVIGLLVAGGYVTQAKVDEARAIALGLIDEKAMTPASAHAGEVVPEWTVERGGKTICSSDFEHDVVLNVSGDFATDEQRLAYSERLAAALNTAALGASHEA